jgi:hypothetical protein
VVVVVDDVRGVDVDDDGADDEVVVAPSPHPTITVIRATSTPRRIFDVFIGSTIVLT